MTQVVKVADCDIIYLSYDEPNAERNYADLLTKVPWAKRVHGVEGSDAAHKACAKIAETSRVVIIDGDNIINKDLLKQEIKFKPEADLTTSVISWGASNIINGLIYGNGGIKCWPRELILNMKTHEYADPTNAKAQVDFCWDINYVQIDKCMSHVYNNDSPQQAWRAGFREGVKMGLIEGSKANPENFAQEVHWKNLHRLLIWMNVGMDVKNAQWAIYGARHGCYQTNCTDWNYINVRDFSWLNNFWDDNEKLLTAPQLAQAIDDLGLEISSKLSLPVDKPLNKEQSKLFKMTYTNPPRLKSNLLFE